MSNIIKQVFISVICIIMLFSFLFESIAANEINNNQVNVIANTANTVNTFNSSNTVNNTTSDIKPLTLQQQREAVNENLNKANEQLAYVQNELSQAVLKIQDLQDKINGYESTISKINLDYGKLQEKVEQTEVELIKQQVRYDAQEELLKKRLVAVYNKGNISYLNVLLGANNFIEFLSLYTAVSQIAKYDKSQLDNMKAEKTEIQRKNDEMTKQKEEIRLAKANAQQQEVLLTNTKIMMEGYKQSLTESDKQINAQITAYKAQQQEIENMITQSIVQSTYELSYAGGVMIWPTLKSGYITSPFGNRMHPIQGIVKSHHGIDISGAIGTPVYAAADGVIIYSGWMGGYGNTIMIDHGVDGNGNKVISLYGHSSKLLKNVGEIVKQGDTILEIGSTGNSTGPHLHFEIRENGIPTDPKKYLSNENN